MDNQQMESILRGLSGRSLNHTVFVLANKYNETAAMLQQRMAETRDADFCGPIVVNLSFAIELLLKFFIVVAEPDLSFKDLRAAGVDPYGHPLSTLFDRVRPDFQQLIAEEYGRRLGKKQSASDFRAALVATGDRPFVDWRYPFESSEIRHFDLAAVWELCTTLGLAAQAERRRLTANPK